MDAHGSPSRSTRSCASASSTTGTLPSARRSARGAAVPADCHRQRVASSRRAGLRRGARECGACSRRPVEAHARRGRRAARRGRAPPSPPPVAGRRPRLLGLTSELVGAPQRSAARRCAWRARPTAGSRSRRKGARGRARACSARRAGGRDIAPRWRSPASASASQPPSTRDGSPSRVRVKLAGVLTATGAHRSPGPRPTGRRPRLLRDERPDHGGAAARSRSTARRAPSCARAASAPCARARARRAARCWRRSRSRSRRRVDPSAVVFASRRAGEPWFCFEQPDRDGAALAALGCVRAIRGARPAAASRDAAAAWRELAGGAEAGRARRPAGRRARGRRRLRVRPRGRRGAALGGLRGRRSRGPRGGARAPRRRRPAHAGRRSPRPTTMPEQVAERLEARAAELRDGAAAAARPGARRALPRRVDRAARALRGGRRARRRADPRRRLREDRARARGRRPRARRRTTPPPSSACCAPPSAPASCSAPAAATPRSSPPRPSCWCAARASGPRPSRSPARRAAPPTRRSTTTSASSCCAPTRTARSSAIVARRIARALRPHSVWVTAPDEPTIIKVANIQHLATPIRAQLTHPRSAIELAGLLHPTPAVGGEPHAVATPQIPALEGLDRGWYAGPVGWTDANEDGEFCVALRCALLRGPRGAAVRRRRRRARLRPGGRAGRDRGQARRAAPDPDLTRPGAGLGCGCSPRGRNPRGARSRARCRRRACGWPARSTRAALRRAGSRGLAG